MRARGKGALGLALAALALAVLSLAAAGGAIKKNGELVIEDSEVVSWTPINNTFNFDPGHTPWDGVLIQVGDYLDDGHPFNIFTGISYVDDQGVEQKLDPGTFKWINIVAVDPARTDPMAPQHLSLLYPEPGTVSGCGDFDACALENCSCASPPCATTGFNPVDRCLRLRSLHGSFTPYAVITYWQGSNGFDVSITPLSSVGKNSKQVFSFKDPVQIYKDGQLLSLGKVISIHVNSSGGTTHGASTDPPWYP